MLLLLEALAALVLLLLLVWWTMFSGRQRGELMLPEPAAQAAKTAPDIEDSEQNKH